MGKYGQIQQPRKDTDTDSAQGSAGKTGHYITIFCVNTYTQTFKR